MSKIDKGRVDAVTRALHGADMDRERVSQVTFALTGEFKPGMRVKITDAQRTGLSDWTGRRGTLDSFIKNDKDSPHAPRWTLHIDGEPRANYWCREDCMEPVWDE